MVAAVAAVGLDEKTPMVAAESGDSLLCPLGPPSWCLSGPLLCPFVADVAAASGILARTSWAMVELARQPSHC